MSGHSSAAEWLRVFLAAQTMSACVCSEQINASNVAESNSMSGAADVSSSHHVSRSRLLHAAHRAQQAPWQQHSFLFMGGLQRSGTTWLESLVSSSRVSGLSFDNVNLSAYRQQQPWRLQNHTQEYFEMVVRSGGVEGKFVQGEYPYVYLVRDVGRRGLTLDTASVQDTDFHRYVQG
jgi:hypothetical protein